QRGFAGARCQDWEAAVVCQCRPENLRSLADDLHGGRPAIHRAGGKRFRRCLRAAAEIENSMHRRRKLPAIVLCLVWVVWAEQAAPLRVLTQPQASPQTTAAPATPTYASR